MDEIENGRGGDWPLISVITATYNVAGHLPELVASLRAQTSLRFEWIVVDGASNDSTVNILRSANDLPQTWISEPDFGVYDALNKGIRLAKGEYYLVLGADDRLEPDAIENYSRAAKRSGADIITATVRFDDLLIKPSSRPRPWLNGQFAYITAHAVGALFRTSLHSQVGFYSRRYPIAADQLFVKKAMIAGALLEKSDFIAGRFGTSGMSSSDLAGSLSEFFRVQLETERKMPQFFLYFARLLKHYGSI